MRRPGLSAGGVLAGFLLGLGLWAALPVGAVPAPAVPAAFIRPAAVPFPADNPHSPEKAALGERLFFDARLSGGNGMSCAACHDPAKGWSDGVPLGRGEAGTVLTRRTPAIPDLAWGRLFFWDGRASSLEEQALGPIASPVEMAQDLAALPAELAADPAYPALFRAAFPEAEGRITAQDTARALATFQRTVRTSKSPFDRWAAGDQGAMSDPAKRGFALFTGAAGCAGCHSGWRFTDDAFHDIGLPSTDRGRGAVLGDAAADHAFKTPSLRDAARRAPYMHDGSLPTLAAVIEHYAAGIVERPGLSEDLPRGLVLGARDKADLLAFLESLTGDTPAAASVPSVAKATPAPAPAAGSAPALVTVSQKDRDFAPAVIRLSAGGSLEVLNDDTRRHNVRVEEPNLSVNTGIQRPGETVHIRFPEPGRYGAYCGIHPEMRLTVEVAPPPGARR